MQSFKSFLKESKGPIKPSFKVELISKKPNGFAEFTKKNFYDYLSTIDNTLKFDINYLDDNEVSFGIKDLPLSFLSDTETLINKIKKLFKDKVDFTINDFTLELFELPKQPIHFPVIAFHPVENSTLENVHKLIFCKNFKMYRSANIIGNALGLLKMQTDDINIFISGSSNHYPDWLKIIDKHFRQGKNVLKCQKELIENGYKDYAKF